MSKNNSEDLIYIGEKIREERKRQNISQECLAEDADVSFKTINRAENGEGEIKVSTLIAICDALATSPNNVMPSRLAENDKMSGFAFSIDSRLKRLSDSKRKKAEQAISALLDAVEL